jgi:ribonuclease HIII
MKHYSMPVSTGELDKLNRLYQSHTISDDNPYILFHAVHNNSHILAYKSGKILLQGDDVSSELILIKKHLNKHDYDAIGSDEVGTGDAIGPVVVCSACVTAIDFAYLESLGVRDSKTIDDQTIMQLGPKLIQKVVHTLLIVPPEKYNELTERGYNLNKIKALLHNQAIIKLKSKVEKEMPVILDQFCTPQLYFNYLKDETLIHRHIQFHTKAESVHLSVAVASMIARYAFLLKMDQLSEKIGFTLKKGASSEVDTQIKHMMDMNIDLKHYCKMNFKNVTKQLN